MAIHASLRVCEFLHPQHAPREERLMLCAGTCFSCGVVNATSLNASMTPVREGLQKDVQVRPHHPMLERIRELNSQHQQAERAKREAAR
jgi:hypothetical protein